MKIFKVEIQTVEIPYKHIEMVSAETELDAIDTIVRHYEKDLHKEIIDIKVV